MDSDAIFMVRDGSLVPMVSTKYESESLLQKLLADFPDLIAGGQVDPDAPRRWVLVGREVGVPDHEGGSDRWSLDNLFLDQDAIPTVVEVKRSSDTRIRREVVGQMLDYAANGVQYWPIDSLRGHLEANHAHPEEAIAELTDDHFTYDDFWHEVEKNLRERRIRMVWVADAIPTELRTIIEYLNEELTNAEALAVEVQQYVGDGVQTLVPRVLGMSATARLAKRSRLGSYDVYLAHASDATKELAGLFWALGDTDNYETSTTKAALKIRFADIGTTAMLLYPRWGSVEFYLGSVLDAGLEDEARELKFQLSELAGKPLTDRNPYIRSEPLLSEWQKAIDVVLPRYHDALQTVERLKTEQSDD